MADRTSASLRRGAASLIMAACYAIACGDGTGPAPMEPMIGALQVSAASPSGWAFLVEGPGGEGSYITGPGSPPLGFGSARLHVSSTTGGVILGTLAYRGTRLDQITALQYSSYVSAGSAPFIAAALQFNIDYDLSDANTAWQGRLVYEPYYSETVTQGTWQSFSPLTGVWWASGAPGNAVCPISAPCTWATVLATYPNAGIRDDDAGGLLFKAGSGWATSTVHVDAFAITAAGASETYDFEPSLEPCAFAPAAPTRTVRLTDHCTTDHTLYIPNGWSVDGAGFTITAVNPATGDFLGPVIRNGGARAHARGLHIVGDFAGSGGCHGGAERLAGIAFEEASGTIMFSTVENILRAPHYGCQEGNGIQVRNAPFDGTHPNTQEVLIQQNTILRYQKTGILANGDVRVEIISNEVSSAADADGNNLDYIIAGNAIQVGFGAAHATIHGNRIQGNDFDGVDWWDGTAMLIFQVSSVAITSNRIGAGSPGPLDEKTDIGIWVDNSRNVNIMNNYIGRHDEDESSQPCETGTASAPELERPADAPGGACDPDGIGVYLAENSGITNVMNNRFAGGWHELQIGADHARRNRVVDPIE